MQLMWIVGPSGAGKSTVLDALRRTYDVCTFDLDFVGFRAPGAGFTKWTIPPGIFQVLRETALGSQRPMIAGGVAMNGDAMRTAARKAGFKPIVLLPSVEQLTKNREKRGDEPEKITETSNSHAHWKVIAGENAWPLVERTDDILALVAGFAELKSK